jgi:adenylate cyclase
MPARAKRPSNGQRGVLRRVPTLAFIADLPFLSLPLEMVRQALGDDGRRRLKTGRMACMAIRIGDYRLPTQANGELLLHFGRASANYYLSAADVLAGVHPPGNCSPRFVLIGFNSTGLQDRIVTPLGESLPGSDIHAQVIESLLAGQAYATPTGCPGWKWPRCWSRRPAPDRRVLPTWARRYAVADFRRATGGLILAGGYLPSWRSLAVRRRQPVPAAQPGPSFPCSATP